MSKYRVLLIDDEEAVRRALGRYFEKLGYEVFLASNGKDGVGLYEQVSPHVAVVDLQMPEMSGIEVLKYLRRQRAMVIMLTGHGEIETAVKAMQMGAENFLEKPVDMGHLAAAVEKAAEKAVLRIENRQLRDRLAPSAKRFLARAALVVVLVGGAVGVGAVIGGERSIRPSRPIPVPFEPQDTVSQPPEEPLLQGAGADSTS